MAKGVVQIEMSIEDDIIRELNNAVSLIYQMYVGVKQPNLIKVIDLGMHQALFKSFKLENLEYYEKTSQKWKRWEVEEIKDAQDIMREISEKLADINFLASAAWKKSAIAKLERAIDIFHKMKKYELQIGG
jgi:hypothetical protein